MRIVERTIAALAPVIVSVCSAFQALAAFFYLAPLLVLQSGLSADQGTVAVVLKLNTEAFQLDLVLFGLWCVLTGYLIWRCRFLPRILAILLMADGVGWSLFLWPPLALYLFHVIAMVSALAELPMHFWLIFFGANSTRWYEQAHAAGTASPELLLQEVGVAS